MPPIAVSYTLSQAVWMGQLQILPTSDNLADLCAKRHQGSPSLRPCCVLSAVIKSGCIPNCDEALAEPMRNL